MPENRKPIEPVKLFYSYSHKDEKYRDKLETHLAPLRRLGFIKEWYDRKIIPGKEVDKEIDKNLRSSEIILLLISPDFINSDYCYTKEMQTAMELRENKKACVISVILRKCDWRDLPFGKLLVLPTDGKHVKSWDDEDKAFYVIEQGIKKAVIDFRGGDHPPVGAQAIVETAAIFNVSEYHGRNPNFTGRESILAELRNALTSGKAAAITQAIHGLGGIGKTQLAIEYAYRHRQKYDIVWWIHSEQRAKLANDYAMLANELNLPEKDSRDQGEIIKAVKRELERRGSWLLIFDNVNKREDVKDYLPRGEAGHVIITSRNPVWGGIADKLQVNKLDRTESISFLLKRTGQDDADNADKLADTLGDFPLALEQAGAYIETNVMSLVEYVKLFKENKAKLLDFPTGADDYTKTVATTWNVSFNKIKKANTAAIDMLNLCAFLAPDDIPKYIFKEGKKHLPDKLAEVVSDDIKRNEALAALRKYSIIELSSETFSIHRLVQEVIRGRLNNGEKVKWAEAAVRIVNYSFPQESNDVTTWPVCGRLLPHAKATAMYAQEFETGLEETSRLLNQVGLYLKSRAEFSEAKETCKRALEIAEEIYGNEHEIVAIRLNNLGLVLKDMGDLKGAKANYERALEIGIKTLGEDHPKIAIRLNNFGLVLQVMGDFKGAKTNYERALEIDRKNFEPDHPSIAIRLNNLGGVLRAMGDLKGAKANFERALEIDRKNFEPDHPDIAIDLNNLGDVLKAMGDLKGAKANFERALDIFTARLGEKHPSTLTVRKNLEYLVREMRGGK